MATDNGFLNFTLERLSGMDGISYRKAFGEYLLYYDGVLFGGLYDDRFLIKKTKGNAVYSLPEEIPYGGAKPMYSVDETENKNLLMKIIIQTVKDLKK